MTDPENTEAETWMIFERENGSDDTWEVCASHQASDPGTAARVVAAMKRCRAALTRPVRFDIVERPLRADSPATCPDSTTLRQAAGALFDVASSRSARPQSAWKGRVDRCVVGDSEWWAHEWNEDRTRCYRCGHEPAPSNEGERARVDSVLTAAGLLASWCESHLSGAERIAGIPVVDAYRSARAEGERTDRKPSSGQNVRSGEGEGA